MGLDEFQFELTSNLRVVHAPRDHGGRSDLVPTLLTGLTAARLL
jgi:hypothetical protein